MTNLSVNINKLATLRNARGGNMPDLLHMATLCQQFGAQGITVHPRPDERHIRYNDVRQLKPLITTEFNIEGYPSENFLKLIEEVHPDQVTLVPDAPGDITSHAGWKVTDNMSMLTEIVARLHEAQCRVSIFVDPDSRQVEAAAKTKADRIELYTEPYASAYAKGQDNINIYRDAAQTAVECLLGVNAGHDLNQDNLGKFYHAMPRLDEVSIGHALICEALLQGLKTTINNYRKILTDN
ncbi:MAG TPA: pyridoxine 5'-phosphate synthase [Bacteroidales bacterium]|nr:pyridoxine 5'-phosphate synthase [Bacteroidales bacterium]